MQKRIWITGLMVTGMFLGLSSHAWSDNTPRGSRTSDRTATPSADIAQTGTEGRRNYDAADSRWGADRGSRTTGHSAMTSADPAQTRTEGRRNYDAADSQWGADRGKWRATPRHQAERRRDWRQTPDHPSQRRFAPRHYSPPHRQPHFKAPGNPYHAPQRHQGFYRPDRDRGAHHGWNRSAHRTRGRHI